MHRVVWQFALLFGVIGVALIRTDAWAVHDEVLAVGVPTFSDELNVAFDTSLASSVLREIATSPLLVSSLRDSGGYVLSLVDRFSVDQKPPRWLVRLRSSATFSNGRRVSAEDVVWSLSECSSRWLKRIAFKAHITPRPVGEDGESVTIVPSEDFAAEVERLLHECPILERATGVLFGPHLGEGVSFVSTGSFLASSFRPGREYEFQRVVPRKGFPGGIVVKAIASPEQGLEALRVGTIDVLLGLNEEVAKKVEKDETLLVMECSITKVALRRGLSFPCKEKFNLKDVRYARS